jgi:pimeloyl-ACP methyl ester carboxylesterase
MRRAKTLSGIIALALASMGCATRELPFAELRLAYGLPTSRTFEPSPGMRIHYTDEGLRDGRTLILVHGFAASVHAWRPWIERLSSDYRLIAIDLPGHGLTETPAGYRASLEGNAQLVDALATHLGVDRFVLAGNSMGGAVSIAYAMKRADRLDGLVLVDAAGWPGERSAGPPPLVFAMLNNGFARSLMKLIDPRLLARDGLKAAYVDPAIVNEALVDRYANLAMAEGHRDVLLTQDSRPNPPWTPESFEQIRTPTLVMTGEKDALIPADNARAIANAIPGAYLVTYPEGGHVPMEQLPDETVRHLRAFVQGLPARN